MTDLSRSDLVDLMNFSTREDGYRRSPGPLQFNGKPIQRNKARLTTGEIVEYDEAIEVDPSNSESPSPEGKNCCPKYLGIGEVVEVRGARKAGDGRLLHLWEYGQYGLRSPAAMPALYDPELPLNAGTAYKVY